MRQAASADFEQIRRIQRESPEAAQWEAADYSVVVAEVLDHVAGFVAWRATAPGEVELLNLAVASRFRRMGVASALIAALPAANIFLEVRESNSAARELYRNTGFSEVGIRFGYYSHPAESAVVMRRQS